MGTIPIESGWLAGMLLVFSSEDWKVGGPMFGFCMTCSVISLHTKQLCIVSLIPGMQMETKHFDRGLRGNPALDWHPTKEG